MPKLPPPPPWQAQNRSGCSSGLTRSASPAAVTTSVSSSWSQVSPKCRLLNPKPPPSSSPLTPTVGHRPLGTARPVPARPSCRSRLRVPAPSVTVSARWSTRIDRIRASEMTRPRLAQYPA